MIGSPATRMLPVPVSNALHYHPRMTSGCKMRSRRNPITRRVLKQFRNHGNSFGLEFPFVYGALPRLGRTAIWSIWHRRTGKVVWESDVSPQLDQCLHEDAAMQKCMELNKIPDALDLAVKAAIDATP